MAPPARARPLVYIVVFLLAIAAVIFAQEIGLDEDIAAFTLNSARILHVSFLVFMVLVVFVPGN